MGAAPTIQDEAAKNKAFQAYIDDRNAELDKTAAAVKKDMTAQLKAFYTSGGWDDAKPLASGSYQHLSTASTWSLDHVTAMIDAVRGAVFGGPPAPPPKPDPNVPAPKEATGNSVQQIDPKTKALMGLMGGTELLIANATFEIISGILSQFKSSIQTDLVKNIKQKDLLPGMSLWVAVLENKYHRTDFFNDEIIIQNFYVYDCWMSINRAADIAKMDRVQGLIKQQLDLDAAVGDVSQQIHDMKVADYKTKHQGSIVEAMKDYKADFGALNDMVTDYNKQIAATGKLIDDLRSKQHAANAALVAGKRREMLAM